MRTDGFSVTASADGIVKFWKTITKHPDRLEFVKSHRAHMKAVQDISASNDGSLLCCIGEEDRSAKIFDVQNFDMMNVIDLKFLPEHAALSARIIN